MFYKDAWWNINERLSFCLYNLILVAFSLGSRKYYSENMGIAHKSIKQKPQL